MSKKINLKIITPEKLVLEEIVDMVLIPTTEGEIGILPNHIPLIARLKSGDVVGRSGTENLPVAVVGGFAEVKKDELGNTNVIILADFAENVANLTDEIIARAKARAEELKIEMEKKGNIDFEHFSTELERSITQIKIADKWKTRKYRK